MVQMILPFIQYRVLWSWLAWCMSNCEIESFQVQGMTLHWADTDTVSCVTFHSFDITDVDISIVIRCKVQCGWSCASMLFLSYGIKLPMFVVYCRNEGHSSTFRPDIPRVHFISGRIQDSGWRILWNHLTHWGRDNMATFFPGIFKWIFLIENVWILIEISFKFVPKCQINNLFMWWLGVDQATSHYVKQWWLVYSRIFA